MTTNQTIDGVLVSRALLNELSTCIGVHITWPCAIELRALLDAPVGFSTPDCPDCACVQDGQCLCIPSKPAAKPQGEPVAWIKPDVAKTLTKDGCCYAFGSQNPKGTLIPLYAQQPARLQDNPIKWVPTVAQIRHRRPERNCPNWGSWHDLKVEIYDENRTNYIDTAGWECETRLLYLPVTKS